MRARNLKPSVFTNELLAVADPLYTVIFEGLWCLADREGVLEDRPAKIHMTINPGRGFDSTVRSLEWLIENGFVLRYEVNGIRCLWVREFSKHQHPHKDEKSSDLPRPPKSDISTMPAPCQHHADTVPPRPLTDSLLPLTDCLIRAPTVPRACEGESETEIRTRVDGIKDVYPKAARPDWITGEKNARNLVSNGAATWDELCAGAKRYGDHCRATGRMALNPARFFADVDRPWTHPWDIPPAQHATGKKSNDDAAWAEAKAAAGEIGFRAPWPQESPGAYMTQIKLARDRSPPRSVTAAIAPLTAGMRVAAK